MAGTGQVICFVGEARLTHDTETFGSMDPYCLVLLGKHTAKTSVKNGAGKKPLWNETLTFNRYDEQNLRIVVYDKDPAADDVIGSCDINLMPVFSQGYIDKWFDLTYSGSRAAGSIHCILQWKPDVGAGAPGYAPVAAAAPPAPVYSQAPPSYPQQAPGYPAHPQPYGAPPAGYGAPPASYAAPPSAYGAPPAGYPHAYPGQAPAPAGYPGAAPQYPPAGYPGSAPQYPPAGYPQQAGYPPQTYSAAPTYMAYPTATITPVYQPVTQAPLGTVGQALFMGAMVGGHHGHHGHHKHHKKFKKFKKFKFF